MHASGFSRGTVAPSSLESSTRADREGGEFWNLAYVGPNPGLPDFSCASSGNTCISAQPPSRGWGSAPRGCRQEGQVCGARCCLAGPRFPSQHDGMSQILLCVTARCLADLVPHRCTPGGHSVSCCGEELGIRPTPNLTDEGTRPTPNLTDEGTRPNP